MTMRLFIVCLVLVLLVVAVGLSCENADYPRGDVEVEATLCGEPWSGDVQYRLDMVAWPTIHGTAVPQTHGAVGIGEWTCHNISGGPPGAYLDIITPFHKQTLTDDGTVTFTLKFEMPRDPGIKFANWTINGEPVDANEPEEPYKVYWGDIIDVHFEQHAAGCIGQEVEIIEKSELILHYADEEGAWVGFHVIDDLCAVEKTPEPVELVSRSLLVDGDPVERCMEFDLEIDKPRVLSAERTWKLLHCTTYEKKINWLRIGDDPEPTNGDCVLFDLRFESPGYYLLKLVASAEVRLTWQVADIDDPDTSNNSDESPPLYILVEIGP